MSYVYILTNHSNSLLYIGVTGDVVRRVYEHKQELVEGFTKTYHIHKLVYVEQFEEITRAIEREKQLKKWNHDWKVRLISNQNPTWKDLYPEICF
jgi:putative endonuclease